MKKHVFYTLVFFTVSSLLVSFNITKNATDSKCQNTPRGWAVAWQENQPLVWDDFQALEKEGGGFAIASASCNFGFDEIDGDIKLFVRFYCNESWKNTYLIESVLHHEQLHFDICEVYGRKFYKLVLALESQNNLSVKRLEKEFDSLQIEYEAYQTLYDKETDHSTNGEMQRFWNQKISDELAELKAYADYSKY